CSEIVAIPEVFPNSSKVAYIPESRQLAMEWELPTLDKAVPEHEGFRYIKKGDRIVEIKRADKARNEIYSNAIAQAVLRCLHNIFRSDVKSVVETIVLNGHVS